MMTDYRELLRLQNLGFNNSQIAASAGIARQTVITALQRASVQGLNWQTAESLSDRELAKILFPPATGKGTYKTPDFEWIHREMSKPGVTLQLLWFEYSDKCREAGEIPYQLSQFKKHYRDYTLKNVTVKQINAKKTMLQHATLPKMHFKTHKW